MKTWTVELSRSEIEHLYTWHEGCEKRCAEMREYVMADEHKQRLWALEGLKRRASQSQESV